MKKKPISILDLAPPAQIVVDTSRGPVEVFPIGAAGIAHIITRFPVILAIGSGASLRTIINAAPEALKVIVAIACGCEGAEGEAAAEAMVLPDQMRIAIAAVDASFPGGISSFFDELASVTERHAQKQAPKPRAAGSSRRTWREMLLSRLRATPRQA